MKSKQKQRQGDMRRQKAKAKRKARASTATRRSAAAGGEPRMVMPTPRAGSVAGLEGLMLPDRRSMERSLAELGGRSSNAELAEAQEIMYEAFEARSSSTRARLAREALAVCPDCADAYVLLAEETTTSPEEALVLYQQAVEAGERALGEEPFEQDVGHFWGLLETRPYMRARFGLAECLLAVGRTDEAREHMQALLRLNPNDNQGVRDVLASVLANAGADDALEALLHRYEDDITGSWKWTRVLLACRRGDPPGAIAASLAEARRCNPHVPDYLLGRRPLLDSPPPYIELGGETEAAVYAASYGRAWASSPSALQLLRQHVG